MNRFHGLRLTALAATLPLLLAACGDDSNPSSTAAPSTATAASSEAFQNVNQCVAAGNTQDECQQALNFAMANQAKAPTYATAQSCVDTYGADHCQVRRDGDHDVWMPMMAGFMIGHLLSNNTPSYTPIYYGRSGGYVHPTYDGGHWSSAPVSVNRPYTYTKTTTTTTHTNGSSTTTTTRTKSSGYTPSYSSPTYTAPKTTTTASRSSFGSTAAARSSWSGGSHSSSSSS